MYEITIVHKGVLLLFFIFKVTPFNYTHLLFQFLFSASERNQKIAKRIKKQTIRASSKIRTQLKSYNTAGFVDAAGNIADTLQYLDVNKPNNAIFQKLYGDQSDTNVSNFIFPLSKDT